MISNLFRAMLMPVTLVAIVGTCWMLAWSQDVGSVAARGYYPAPKHVKQQAMQQRAVENPGPTRVSVAE